ncbi:MAG: hypothetical protein R3F59_16895 [Myxococcota bacterium]
MSVRAMQLAARAARRLEQQVGLSAPAAGGAEEAGPEDLVTASAARLAAARALVAVEGGAPTAGPALDARFQAPAGGATTAIWPGSSATASCGAAATSTPRCARGAG